MEANCYSGYARCNKAASCLYQANGPVGEVTIYRLVLAALATLAAFLRALIGSLLITIGAAHG